MGEAAIENYVSAIKSGTVVVADITTFPGFDDFWGFMGMNMTALDRKRLGEDERWWVFVSEAMNFAMSRLGLRELRKIWPKGPAGLGGAIFGYSCAMVGQGIEETSRERVSVCVSILAHVVTLQGFPEEKTELKLRDVLCDGQPTIREGRFVFPRSEHQVEPVALLTLLTAYDSWIQTDIEKDWISEFATATMKYTKQNFRPQENGMTFIVMYAYLLREQQGSNQFDANDIHRIVNLMNNIIEGELPIDDVIDSIDLMFDVLKSIAGDHPDAVNVATYGLSLLISLTTLLLEKGEWRPPVALFNCMTRLFKRMGVNDDQEVRNTCVERVRVLLSRKGDSPDGSMISCATALRYIYGDKDEFMSTMKEKKMDGYMQKRDDHQN